MKTLATALLLATAALATPLAAAPVVGDPAAGGVLFKARCMACHVIAPGAKGVIAPNLRGVVGRKAASTPFAYSPALKASGKTWTRAQLDAFLTSPATLVPGTRMVISLPDPKPRADVIAWLATQK